MAQTFSSLTWDTVFAFADAAYDLDGHHDYAAGYLGSILVNTLIELHAQHPKAAEAILRKVDQRAREFRGDLAVRELKSTFTIRS